MAAQALQHGRGIARQIPNRRVNNGQDVRCTVCNGMLRVSCHPTLHFPFNIDVQAWKKASKKTRQKHVGEFLILISILYNGGGGFVLLHTDQLYLSFFDEQVDDRLMAMIPDGSMFDERYRRQAVDDRHVSFQVLPPSPIPPPHSGPHRLCFLDFHSTISLNKGRAKPNYSQMKHLLTRGHCLPTPLPSPFLGHRLVRDNIFPFTENRSLQAKQATAKDLQEIRETLAKARQAENRNPQETPEISAGETLLTLCCERLDLLAFIAGFSKLQQGGYYCVGLEEEKIPQGYRWLPVEGMEAVYDLFKMEMKLWRDKNNPNILHLAEEQHAPTDETRTGAYIVRGVRLPTAQDQQIFRDLLADRLRSSMFCFQTNTGHNQRRSHLQVDTIFHPVLELDTAEESLGAAGGVAEGGEGVNPHLVHKDLYVVEVRVEYYPGVCFQDSGGPEAYQYLHRKNPGAESPKRVSGVACCKNLRV